MATIEECEQALNTLAARLEAKDPAKRQLGFDRSLSCSVRDLRVVFGGELRDGVLKNVHRASDAAAQVRMDLTSDDLVAMVDGRLKVASAWANGRIKIHAGMRDMLKLRSIF